MSSLGNKSDEDLMQSYVYGDTEAFEILYERYRNSVWNYLRKFTQNEQTLSDVMQESFLKLHKSRERFDSSKSFRPWLFTICHNTLIDALRKRGNTREIQGVEVETFEDTSPDSSKFEAPLDEQLLRPLSEREKRVLTLRFENELSYSELASTLGLTEPNTRKVLSRGLLKLKKFLGGPL